MKTKQTPTRFFVSANYSDVRPHQQFVIRYDGHLLPFEDWQTATLHHGTCTVQPDGWAINQHGSKVSFTDNYPVWID